MNKQLGSVKSSQGNWGRAVSSPSGVWVGAPAENEFGAFHLYMTSSGM